MGACVEHCNIHAFFFEVLCSASKKRKLLSIEVPACINFAWMNNYCLHNMFDHIR